MKVLELTEYRDNGNFYPITIVFGDNAAFAILEAELKAPGPHIIGESKDLGKGSFIVGAVPGRNLVVKETAKEIAALLQPNMAGMVAFDPQVKK
jgi:hypothetical protein